MKETDIRKYAGLMKELGLTGLELTDGNGTVRLERAVPAQAEKTVYAVPETSSAPVQAAENRDYISVKSPIVGVFYAAPAENAEAFIKAGDRVEAGDTLCIIEAMKLMNEITAERAGTIRQVCAVNGQVVEYGTVLFELEERA